MASIATAGGTVDTAALGRVLMHEHVFVLSIEMQLNYPQDWGDEDARVDDAAKRLTELKASGIDTIVDLTVVGLGRYVPRIARIAQLVDLNVVVATGYYTFDRLPGFFLHRSPTSGPGGRDPLVVTHAALWALGNTPFEREAHWGRLLATPLAAARLQEIERTLLRGWPLATPATLQAWSDAGGRRTRPLPRGRPRKAAV